MLTPQEASALIDKGIKELEEFAGAVTPPQDPPLPAEIADLEADLMMLSDAPIFSGGAARRLPKKKRPAAAARTTPPPLSGSAAMRRPAAGRPATVPKSSPYKLATSKAYHRAVKKARNENRSEEECKKRGVAASDKVKEEFLNGVREW